MSDPVERRLWVLAVITECLSPTGIQPVLVGGAAVEFYTSGGYTTLDVDVVCDSQVLDGPMSDLGFVKEGRHWIREDLSMAIEAPSSSLPVVERERVLAVRVDGMTAYVLGVEDLIIDRLNAFVHWQSKEDGRWAAHLIAENRDQIDWDYLKRRAVEEKCDAALNDILKDLQPVKSVDYQDWKKQRRSKFATAVRVENSLDKQRSGGRPRDPEKETRAHPP